MQYLVIIFIAVLGKIPAHAPFALCTIQSSAAAFLFSDNDLLSQPLSSLQTLHRYKTFLIASRQKPNLTRYQDIILFLSQ